MSQLWDMSEIFLPLGAEEREDLTGLDAPSSWQQSLAQKWAPPQRKQGRQWLGQGWEGGPSWSDPAKAPSALCLRNGKPSVLCVGMTCLDKSGMAAGTLLTGEPPA